MYEYKVVSGDIDKSKTEKSVSDILEEMLNSLQNEGWEFYQHATITEVVPPGCLEAFLFHKDVEYRYHQTFVFRKIKK